MAQTRTLIKVTIRRRDAPPISKQFWASYWHRRRITLTAGDSQLIILDGRPALAGGPTSALLALRCDPEGVQWWKIKSSAPSILDSPVLPKKYLRPFEITTDGNWITGALQFCKPAIVVYNPTERDSMLDIFYAVSDEPDTGEDPVEET